MKLATLYGSGGRTALHVALDTGFTPVDTLAQGHGQPELAGLGDVGDLLRSGPGALETLRSLGDKAEATVPLSAARFAPPVVQPGKIVCVGLNYLSHIEESRASIPERIVLFTKFSTSLVGHGAAICLPNITTQLDYEGELAIIIGRLARQVRAADAMDFVAGYTIINDVSARDLQLAEPQWIRAKALDTFAPMGPVMLDAASAPPTDEFHIRTIVNGDVRQDASCSLMITPVPKLIEYISGYITLEPGDVIATGTPAGVAFGMAIPVYLAQGDSVVVEISGIGRLENSISSAPRA